MIISSKVLAVDVGVIKFHLFLKACQLYLCIILFIVLILATSSAINWTVNKSNQQNIEKKKVKICTQILLLSYSMS